MKFDTVIVVEASCGECLYCLYGGIPEDNEIPFPVCTKHMDIVMFLWDKAKVPYYLGHSHI